MKKTTLTVLWVVATAAMGCGSGKAIVEVDPDLSALNCKRFESYVKLLNKTPKDDSRGEPVAVADTANGDDEGSVPTERSVVSEADIVKAQGSILYTLKSVPIVRTTTADEPESPRTGGVFHTIKVDKDGKISPLDSIATSGSPQEFLLEGMRALVISIGSKGDIYGTTLELIDLKDPANLTVIDAVFLPKTSYVTSRAVSGIAHVVLSRLVRGRGPKIVEGDVLPTSQKRTSPDQWDSEKPVSGCETTYIPDDVLVEPSYHYRSLLTIASMNLGANSLSPSGSSVVFGGYNPVVSVNAESIFIASQSYVQKMDLSTVFKFDIRRNAAHARLVAKGTVPGQLNTAFGGYNDQFSMDEFEGHLRVATTSGSVGRGGSSSAESSLFVLKQEGKSLKIVGELRDLHPGESIYAVRFLGKRGYVVTFKKIDPLFVIDLSDPTKPVKVGELEVPGFSTYLTEVDENTLLAIGKDADDQGGFAWFLGVKLALFDVSDASAPRLIDSVTIGERGTESEALRDHRAFSFFKERGLVAFPVELVTEVPDEDQPGWRSAGWPDHSEEQVWKVDRTEGFTHVASIRHDDTPQDPIAPCGSLPVELTDCLVPPMVRLRRALEVGGNLVTLSEERIKSHDFDDLDAYLSTWAFPE